MNLHELPYFTATNNHHTQAFGANGLNPLSATGTMYTDVFTTIRNPDLSVSLHSEEALPVGMYFMSAPLADSVDSEAVSVFDITATCDAGVSMIFGIAKLASTATGRSAMTDFIPLIHDQGNARVGIAFGATFIWALTACYRSPDTLDHFLSFSMTARSLDQRVHYVRAIT